MDWPTELESRLRHLWDDKALSTAAIGRRLGVSKNAVVGKAKRLGLPNRPSPIKPSEKPREVRPLRAGAVTLPPLASLQ